MAFNLKRQGDAELYYDQAVLAFDPQVSPEELSFGIVATNLTLVFFFSCFLYRELLLLLMFLLLLLLLVLLRLPPPWSPHPYVVNRSTLVSLRMMKKHPA